jgi:hypothetical protein
MAYVVDLSSSIHDPATGNSPPATWGDAINANFLAAFPIAPDVAWSTWTPTWANLTVGNGTTTARYFRVGRWIVFELKFVMGSSSTMGTNPTYTLPVTAASRYTASLDTYGTISILDSGTANYGGVSFVSSTTVGFVQVWNSSTTSLAAAGVTATLPMTWTTSDGFVVKGFYEAAS